MVSPRFSGLSSWHVTCSSVHKRKVGTRLPGRCPHRWITRITCGCSGAGLLPLEGAGPTWAPVVAPSPWLLPICLGPLERSTLSIETGRLSSNRHGRWPRVSHRRASTTFRETSLESLELPPLDGVVMANALHFVRRKEAVLDLIRSYLVPGGSFLLVEYNTNRGNLWVPHPISFRSWELLAARVGFASTRLLETVPSRFLGEIYSALSLGMDGEETARGAGSAG